MKLYLPIFNMSERKRPGFWAILTKNVCYLAEGLKQREKRQKRNASHTGIPHRGLGRARTPPLLSYKKFLIIRFQIVMK